MSLVLNDKDIRKLLDKGDKIVDPFDEESLQPASIDLRLGDIYYEYDLDKYILGDPIDEVKINQRKFKTLTLDSGKVAFVGIYEKISIPKNTIGIVFPRSSISRLGVQIITTYMNPGYLGNMPLTIINHTGYKITLKPEQRVAQLVLLSLSDLPDKNYSDITGSKYYNENVKSSRLYTDNEINEMMNEILKEEAPVLHEMIRKSSK